MMMMMRMMIVMMIMVMIMMMILIMTMMMMIRMGLLSIEARSTTLPASNNHTITAWDFLEEEGE